jgi:hypothetical protein
MSYTIEKWTTNTGAEIEILIESSKSRKSDLKATRTILVESLLTPTTLVSSSMRTRKNKTTIVVCVLDTEVYDSTDNTSVDRWRNGTRSTKERRDFTAHDPAKIRRLNREHREAYRTLFASRIR